MKKNFLLHTIQMICLLLVMQSINTIQAQDEYQQPVQAPASVLRGSFHINGGVGFAANKEFKAAYRNNMGDMGLNFGTGFLLNPFGIGKQPRYSPVLIGLDFNWNYLGRDKYEFTNSYEDWKREFWMGNFGALLRLDPMNNVHQKVRFFGDGFAGWGRYWANTKIDKDLLDTIIDDEQYLVGKYNDNNFTWGAGGGLLIGNGKQSGALFMIRAMYYFNGNYTVVDRETVRIENNNLNYQVKTVNANMFTVQIGISLDAK